jgi:hypothetical protein
MTDSWFMFVLFLKATLNILLPLLIFISTASPYFPSSTWDLFNLFNWDKGRREGRVGGVGGRAIGARKGIKLNFLKKIILPNSHKL